MEPMTAITVYGGRKYPRVWNAYGNGALGVPVRDVLEDEFKHEDEVNVNIMLWSRRGHPLILSR
jgi:hypothetical protein